MPWSGGNCIVILGKITSAIGMVVNGIATRATRLASLGAFITVWIA